MLDVAVLGPVDASAPPLTLEDGADMPPGSDLFLVGTPARSTSSGARHHPRDPLTLSRVGARRDAYLQGRCRTCEAGRAEGRSSSNVRGRVVAISTYRFSDAGLVLAASGADVSPVRFSGSSGGGATSDPAAYRRRRGSFEFSIELRQLLGYPRLFVLNGAREPSGR